MLVSKLVTFKKSDFVQAYNSLQTSIDNRVIVMDNDMYFLNINYNDKTFKSSKCLNYITPTQGLELCQKYNIDAKLVDGELFYKMKKENNRVGHNNKKYKSRRSVIRSSE